MLRSNPLLDVYSSCEPQELYHQRIQFCLTVHNEAVTAMAYPEDLNSDSSDETAEQRLARLKQETELAAQIAEEDEEDF
eukprot:SAG11_NODE_1207_length_5524_cov_2.959447_8_plen_79_part_00